LGIVLINQSSAMSDAEIEVIAKACDLQLVNEVADAWGVRSPLRVTAAKSAKKGDYPFFFVDHIPEEPGALAYHYVQDNGVPAGKIGVLTTQEAGDSVSSATSHETVELQCDIFCATWSYSTRLECLVATEACDPVQSQSYKIKVGHNEVEVSNFVTPYYFADDPLGQPLDHLHKLKRPFDIAHGGYQIRMKAGRSTDVYGAGFSDALRAAKAVSRGRTFWRHVTMAVAMQPS
jgi:hypothetical protein